MSRLPLPSIFPQGPAPAIASSSPRGVCRENGGAEGAWLRSIHSDDGGAGGGTVERADEHRLQATITPRLGTGDHSHVASSPAQRILSGFTTTATTQQNSASTTTIDLSSKESRCRLLNRCTGSSRESSWRTTWCWGPGSSSVRQQPATASADFAPPP